MWPTDVLANLIRCWSKFAMTLQNCYWWPVFIVGAAWSMYVCFMGTGIRVLGSYISWLRSRSFRGKQWLWAPLGLLSLIRFWIVQPVYWCVFVFASVLQPSDAVANLIRCWSKFAVTHQNRPWWSVLAVCHVGLLYRAGGPFNIWLLLTASCLAARSLSWPCHDNSLATLLILHVSFRLSPASDALAYSHKVAELHCSDVFTSAPDGHFARNQIHVTQLRKW